MSPLLILIVVLLILWLVSQFGSRLSASHALGWWLAGLFLIVVTISPEFFQPVADFLGIELVSNFVMAATIFFVLANLIELTSSHTKARRAFRDLVSTTATREFLRKHAVRESEHSGSRRALVVLPCFNEEAALDGIIERLEALRKHQPWIDYCIVNDGSHDETESILLRRVPDRFVTHGTNIGVSGVLLTGFKIARGLDVDFVVQCDSDGQHPIEDIPRVIESAVLRKTDLMIGSRFAEKGRRAGRHSTTALRVVGSWAIANMLRIFGSSNYTSDPTSGFRAYSRHAVKVLLSHMPDEYPEPESIAVLAIAGAKVGETHVVMEARSSGVSSLAGLKSGRYMFKVFTALIGLRLRSLMGARV